LLLREPPLAAYDPQTEAIIFFDLPASLARVLFELAGPTY
jgi:hypothetical protein